MPLKPLHPVAELFPPMSIEEFAAFKADVAENGLRDPVWEWRGKVIDGRHRQRACDELGVPCHYREWKGEEPELLAFVVSLNIHRRHLNESQRGLIAATLANLKHGQTKESRPANLPVSQPEAAKLLNVSERTVRSAAKVLANCVPEVVEQVRSGQMSVSKAASVAGDDAKTQRDVAAGKPKPPRIQKEDGFVITAEREVVKDWLANRLATWPKQYRPTFRNFIGRIVEDITEDCHEDD